MAYAALARASLPRSAAASVVHPRQRDRSLSPPPQLDPPMRARRPSVSSSVSSESSGPRLPDEALWLHAPGRRQAAQQSEQQTAVPEQLERQEADQHTEREVAVSAPAALLSTVATVALGVMMV